MKFALRLFIIAMIILFVAAAAAPSPTTSDTVTIVVSAAALQHLRAALPAQGPNGSNAVLQLTTQDAADLRLALALALGERPLVTTRPPTSAEKDHSDKDGIEQRTHR